MKIAVTATYAPNHLIECVFTLTLSGIAGKYNTKNAVKHIANTTHEMIYNLLKGGLQPWLFIWARSLDLGNPWGNLIVYVDLLGAPSLGLLRLILNIWLIILILK